MLRFAARFGIFVENNFLPVTIGDDIPVPFRIRPYYDAVANTGTDDAHRLFTDKLESVEKVKLYTTIIPMPRKAKAKISPSWGTIEIGVLGRTHPESSCHQRQKYYLTELGLNILRLLKSEAG